MKEIKLQLLGDRQRKDTFYTKNSKESQKVLEKESLDFNSNT